MVGWTFDDEPSENDDFNVSDQLLGSVLRPTNQVQDSNSGSRLSNGSAQQLETHVNEGNSVRNPMGYPQSTIEDGAWYSPQKVDKLADTLALAILRMSYPFCNDHNKMLTNLKSAPAPRQFLSSRYPTTHTQPFPACGRPRPHAKPSSSHRPWHTTLTIMAATYGLAPRTPPPTTPVAPTPA